MQPAITATEHLYYISCWTAFIDCCHYSSSTVWCSNNTCTHCSNRSLEIHAAEKSDRSRGGSMADISMHALYTHLQYTTQHLVCTHITMCGAVNKQLRINKSVNTLYSPPDKNTYTSDSDIYATIPKPLSTPEICSPKACSL